MIFIFFVQMHQGNPWDHGFAKYDLPVASEFLKRNSDKRLQTVNHLR